MKTRIETDEENLPLDQTAVDAEYAAHLARDPEFVPVDDDDYRLSVNDEEPV